MIAGEGSFVRPQPASRGRGRAALAITVSAGLAGAAAAALAPRAHGREAAAAPATAPTPSPAATLKRDFSDNPLAYIPPQCFTRVKDGPGHAPQNPCYVCHADAPEPNQQSQPELQQAYDFPEPRAGRTAENPWRNLFVDRRSAIAAIPDRDVLAYVAQNNYGDNYDANHDAAGPRGNALARRLARPPADWDRDGNGRWDGYVPDAFFAFDDAGFDHAPDGTPSGWRAYAYYPLPGAFMPTNGSFDDALIRLPAPFREDADGRPSRTVYTLNLAVVEALIKRRDVAIDPVDERALGQDLDGDGALGTARRVAFLFTPGAPARMRFLGGAGRLQAAGRLWLAPGLFPEGTELLHSVRYLTIGPGGVPIAAPRMKELRYARKHHYKTYAQLIDAAQREAKEDALNPDRPAQFLGDAERGLSNALGWAYQGFIEDAAGALRPQTYEETLYCMGCHQGLSTTDDGVFTFSRKVESGRAHGYRAMSLRDEPTAWPDPTRLDGLPEYATYLRANRAGDEFRANDEVLAKFFDARGAERPRAFARLRADVRTLLLPSRARALALDKAYWLVVKEQSFAAGRDAVLAPARNVLATVRAGEPTGITTPLPAPRLAGPGARPHRRTDRAPLAGAP